MKPRTVILLLIVGAIVGVGAWWSLRAKTPGGQAAGSVVFPDFPVNDIAKVVLSDPSGTVSLEKKGTTWVVPECYSYRANYTKVRDLLVSVTDLKVVQKHRVRPSSLGKMKLLGPDDANAATNQQGTAISFYSKTGTRVAMFIVGVEQASGEDEEPGNYFQHREGGGQFIRVPALGDAVISVKEEFYLDKEGKNWIDRLLANVENAGMKSVTVTPPGGTAYTVARKARDTEFEMAGLAPTQQLSSAAASSLGNALTYLMSTTVVPPPVAATNKALDHAWTFVCKTLDGPVYTLTLAATNQPAAYLKMAVAYEKPVEPAPTTNSAEAATLQYKLEDSAKRLNEQVASWMYVMEDIKANELRKTLDAMIEAKPAQETNAVPATAAPETSAVPAAPAPKPNPTPVKATPAAPAPVPAHTSTNAA